jgi:hypothetical protein
VQNFWPSGTSVPQFGHFIALPRVWQAVLHALAL